MSCSPKGKFRLWHVGILTFVLLSLASFGSNFVDVNVGDVFLVEYKNADPENLLEKTKLSFSEVQPF